MFGMPWRNTLARGYHALQPGLGQGLRQTARPARPGATEGGPCPGEKTRSGQGARQDKMARSLSISRSVFDPELRPKGAGVWRT
ncbi:MAG: hypothetical protein AMJ95_13625 [Omnitrophica WOR_2 bacterium SM23_72]|nr:MAG: hypothetical protein AMJ95_13625 [Omnitrophica WOR_2 bacterium SM23_72]